MAQIDIEALVNDLDGEPDWQSAARRAREAINLLAEEVERLRRRIQDLEDENDTE